MGLCNEKKNILPLLLCSYEKDNEEQLSYCVKLKDNFRHEETIRFEIKISHDAQFKISFILDKNTYIIQDIFDDSDEILNESLNKMYVLLDGGGLLEKPKKKMIKQKKLKKIKSKKKKQYSLNQLIKKLIIN